MRISSFKKSHLRLKWDSAKNFKICIITNLSNFKTKMSKIGRLIICCFNNNNKERYNYNKTKWENSN
jgi:hypothetical protein